MIDWFLNNPKAFMGSAVLALVAGLLGAVRYYRRKAHNAELDVVEHQRRGEAADAEKTVKEAKEVADKAKQKAEEIVDKVNASRKADKAVADRLKRIAEKAAKRKKGE